MGKKIITHSNGVVETRETFYTEKTIQQLKQQLEEKDREIEYLKEIRILKDNSNMTTKINGVDFSDEQILTLQNLDILKRYDQTQLAIQELEKVKEACFNKKELVDFGNVAYFMVDIADILEIINNQIKDLRT